METKKGKVKKKMYWKDNLQLLSLSLPVIVLLGIFNYWPMFGVVLAFKNYKVPLGIFGSPWAGVKNFKFFFPVTGCMESDKKYVGIESSVHCYGNYLRRSICPDHV